jgi:hypothetical protein
MHLKLPRNRGGYRIVDLISMLTNISDNLCCKLCPDEVSFLKTAMFSLVSTFSIICKNCGVTSEFQSCPTVKKGRMT